MKLHELVRNSRDPAFACDSNCRIVQWNRAAEELLGLAKGEAVGKLYHDLVPARDTYGNRFCSCVLGPLVRHGELVRHQYVFVPTASKTWLKVSLCTVAVATTASRSLHLHFLRPLEWQEPEERPNGSTSLPSAEVAVPGSGGTTGHHHTVPFPAPDAAAPRWRLTEREVDVLRLMMEGKGAKETAQSLDVSTATVRNHIRGVLRKLKVHSKLEAIALIMRHEPRNGLPPVRASGSEMAT